MSGDQRPLVEGEGGLHRDGDKTRLADMMPWELVLEAGRIWARNNQPVDGYPNGKYMDLPDGRPNFKAGIRLSKYLDSMLRHLMALMQGKDRDQESGFDHAGHLLCNLAMFWWTRANLPAMDDRPARLVGCHDTDMCPRCGRWNEACEKDGCLEGESHFHKTIGKLYDHADMLEKTQSGPEDPVT